VKIIFNKFKYLLLILGLMALVGSAVAQRDTSPAPGASGVTRERVQLSLADVSAKALPPEARETLKLIEKGGPYPYDRDGIVFGNFEKRLPIKDRGYYQEFTVKTPGVIHRGARRIVAGKGGEKYYSDDHYKTFKRIVP